MTMTELCQELRNWFDRGQPKFVGDFTITDGAVENVGLKSGQYYRIMGSVYNDGVYRHGEDILTDETFRGAIWAMAVPPAVIALATDIDEWQNKYSGVVESPYTSESFAGYSYSKSTGYGSANAGATWKDIFSNRLNRWRKI